MLCNNTGQNGHRPVHIYVCNSSVVLTHELTSYSTSSTNIYKREFLARGTCSLKRSSTIGVTLTFDAHY